MIRTRQSVSKAFRGRVRDYDYAWASGARPVAVWIIAMIPARIASGNRSHDSMMTARSGSF
jgi:hypothetical protein